MKKSYLKFGQLIFGLVVLLFFVYIFFHFTEVKQIPSLLASLKWYFILALLVFEFLFLQNRAQIFKVLYNKFGIPMNIWESLKIFIAAYTVNTIAPSAGVAGVALYVSQAEKHKTTKTRVFLITLVFYFINLISLAALMLVPLIYFLVLNQLQFYFWISGLILLAVILISIILIFFAYKKPNLFLKLMDSCINFVNFFLKLLRIKVIKKEVANVFLDELKYFQIIYKKDPWVFWSPFLLFFLGNIYEIIILYIIFFAFGVHPHLLMLTVVYAISLLFMTISITPGGIGIVEPLMAVIFLSSGISLEISGLAVLIFRIITFWLPLPFGIVIMRKYLVGESHAHK